MPKEKEEAAEQENTESVESEEVKESEEVVEAEDEKPEVSEKTEVKAEEKKEAEPIVYDLKLPEDSTVPDFMATFVVDKVLTSAKERGLSNEAAQEEVNKISKGFAEEKVRQTVEWTKTLKKDPDIIGKDGKQYNVNIETAKRAIAHYIKETGNEKIKAFFNEDGTGSHPEMVKFVLFWGQRLSDDKFVHSKSQTGGVQKPDKEVFYGK